MSATVSADGRQRLAILVDADDAPVDLVQDVHVALAVKADAVRCGEDARFPVGRGDVVVGPVVPVGVVAEVVRALLEHVTRLALLLGVLVLLTACSEDGPQLPFVPTPEPTPVDTSVTFTSNTPTTAIVMKR